jgi:hypothetical protein
VSKNKKQHYISAFYLCNFTNNLQKENSKGSCRNTKIWHYEKSKAQIKERPIEKLATESYIFSFKNDDGEYDHSLDEELKKDEELAAKALTLLGDIVASFKKGLTRSVEIDNNVFNAIIKYIVWQVKRDPDLVNKIHNEWIEKCKEKKWDLKPKEMALKVVSKLGEDDYLDLESVLNEKNMSIIFTTNPKTSFITTDVPLVRFNKSEADGIGYESTEIYFPLSSNTLLYLQGKGNSKTFRLENDRKFIKSLNVYMAKKSKRYIFGNTQEHVASIVKCL